ncbi:MAG: SDR family oxidoreductase [Clostridia bacterium]|nr:SDR family oxidoreductase [Clostridia bacterium]
MKKIDYKNKVAIITGASSGIGKEIAKVLTKDYGCTVYGIARNENRLNETKNLLGNKFIPYSMDVSLKENWFTFVDFLKNSGVSVDILINCAGILPKFASFENTDICEYEKAISINYLSQVYGCKTVLPIMNTGGAIVNVASSSALCPFSLVSGYTASKSASYHFTQSITNEIKNVSVSCVLCGFVKTDIMKNQDINEKESELIKMFSADCNKTARKILRRVRRRKKRIVTGFDGHFMSGLYRLFPNFAPKFISWFLKKSGLNIFKN